MRSIIAIFCILFIISSCRLSEYDKKTYDEFPEAIKLRGNNDIYRDTLFFGYPRIKITDSLCCIMDAGTTSKYFHVFSFPDFKHKYSLIHKGRGPNEMSGLINFDLTSEYLYVYSSMLREIHCYDIRSQKTIPSKVIAINRAELPDFDEFNVVSDSLFVFSSLTVGESLHVFNDKSEIVYSGIERPGVAGINPKLAGRVWESSMSYNDKNSMLVISTQGGEILDILNMSTKEHKISTGPNGKPEPTITGNAFIPYSMSGFGYTFAADNHIYVLFSGLKREERIRNKIQDKYMLRVYDYNGNPVRAFDIDENIISFWIDEEESKMYATVEDHENCIFVYEM